MYVTNSSLAYPTNVILTPAGDQLVLLENTSLERLARNLGSNSIVASGAPATRYLSFLLRVSGSFPENAYTAVGFGKAGDNDANIYFNINTFLFKITADASFGNVTATSTNVLSPAGGATYFVVMKVTSDTSGSYQAFAKVYDAAVDAVADTDTDPAFSWDIVAGPFPSNGNNLDRLVVRHGLNVVELDEIRLGNTWPTVAQTQGAAPVTMAIAHSGSDVIITWPAWAEGYTLKSSGNLNTPIENWASEGTGSIVGQNWQVILPATGAGKYFRLVK
jgi:hypothetical protein